MFLKVLDTCTHILGLATAARRLYTTDGQLVTDIGALHCGQLLYVSTGEPFVDLQEQEFSIRRKTDLMGLVKERAAVTTFYDVFNFRNLCITISDCAGPVGTEGHYFEDSATAIRGQRVHLNQRMFGLNAKQRWNFMEDGFIASEIDASIVLGLSQVNYRYLVYHGYVCKKGYLEMHQRHKFVFLAFVVDFFELFCPYL